MIACPQMPPSKDRREITTLLQGVRDGDQAAARALHSALYGELHACARRMMQRQRADHTLQATALVNEAFLRLAGPARGAGDLGSNSLSGWNDREHFLAAAARAMRSVLVDHARRKNADKRDAGDRTELDLVVVEYESRALDLVELDDALERFTELDPEMARAVELRFFGGVTVEECAQMLGMAKRSFERRWAAARAWLIAELTT